jgi:hypothetical protein
VEGLSLAFPDAGPYRLQAALSDLVAGSLVLEEEGEYRRNPEQCSFFSESDTMQQVLGLNRQMDIIAETVWRRLLTEEGRAGAMARTFLFAMDESDAAGMQEEVLAILRSRLVAVDANATEHGVGQRHGLLVAMTGLEED